MLTAWKKTVQAVADGRLSTGEDYYVRLLAPSEFPLAAALDRKVHDSLPPEGRIFFNPHDENWYRNYAEMGNKVYGVFLEAGELTAKANLAFGTDRLEPFGVDPGSRTYRDNKPGALAILSGGAVDPAYQGHGLQKVLMKTRLDAARLSGAHKALTIIHVKNVPSIMSAIKSGLVLSDMGVNPRHNDPVFYFTKALQPRDGMREAAHCAMVHSIRDIPSIKTSLDKGYCGRRLLGAEAIGFQPALEPAAYA